MSFKPFLGLLDGLKLTKPGFLNIFIGVRTGGGDKFKLHLDTLGKDRGFGEDLYIFLVTTKESYKEEYGRSQIFFSKKNISLNNGCDLPEDNGYINVGRGNELVKKYSKIKFNALYGKGKIKHIGTFEKHFFKKMRKDICRLRNFKINLKRHTDLREGILDTDVDMTIYDGLVKKFNLI